MELAWNTKLLLIDNFYDARFLKLKLFVLANSQLLGKSLAIKQIKFSQILLI